MNSKISNATTNKRDLQPASQRIEAGDENDVRSVAMNAKNDRSVHRLHSWLYDDLLA